MQSEKIILDEPFIWSATIRLSNKVIELSKVTNQQIFLIGKNKKVLTNYFQLLNEKEIRAIDLASNISPYSRYGSIDMIFLNLN